MCTWIKYNKCKLYIALSDNPENLKMHRISWIDITNAGIEEVFTGRYLRYKIEIPKTEKLYWLHKKFTTRHSYSTLPYIYEISMSGSYQPEETFASFIYTQSFELLTDGEEHKVLDSVLKLIEVEIDRKGFTLSEVEHCYITCTSSNTD